jgi:hypothetical protein
MLCSNLHLFQDAPRTDTTQSTYAMKYQLPRRKVVHFVYRNSSSRKALNQVGLYIALGVMSSSILCVLQETRHSCRSNVVREDGLGTPS